MSVLPCLGSVALRPEGGPAPGYLPPLPKESGWAGQGIFQRTERTGPPQLGAPGRRPWLCSDSRGSLAHLTTGPAAYHNFLDFS